MQSMHPPSGFRDFINHQAHDRLRLVNLISDVYRSFGYSPVETPTLEHLSLLASGEGGVENEKLIFKVLKRGESLDKALGEENLSEKTLAEFGLRFDLTLPLSRLVAAHRNEISFPWKVFHIGPVWRAERAQRGRFREFIQCDVDILGAKGMGAELDIIQAVVTALAEVGAKGFELRMNDRRLIDALGSHFGFSGEKLGPFAVLLDKKDKMSEVELLEQLKKLAGHQDLSEEFVSILRGKLHLDDAKKFHLASALDLEFLTTELKNLNLPLDQIVFDPSLVRGMGYYTGPVFELRHASAGYSFGGGGRYDDLIGRLSKHPVSAVGLSIGFERLALLLEDQAQSKNRFEKTLFVPIFDESLRGRVLQLLTPVRLAGISVSVYPDHAKIKHQFKYASDLGFKWVLIAGSDELESQTIKLKRFETAEEFSFPISELLFRLKQALD